jgi:hypothetical protein
MPTKNSNGEIVFKDYPDFRPNLTPIEIFQLGSFGGTYWRPIIFLFSRCNDKNTKYNDYEVSPKIRQTLQHWGYQLTSKDYNKCK